MEAEDEEEAVLSSSTLAVLNQFLAEQKKAQEDLADDPFAENWGMSQFWYTDATAEKVAAEVAEVAKGGRIACLACPSLFRRLRQFYPGADAWLFEYDKRFENCRSWGDSIFGTTTPRRICSRTSTTASNALSLTPLI